MKDLNRFAPMMKRAVRETKRLKVEHGFTVCKEKDKLKASKMCVGDKCSVETPRCKWPNTFMEFHTHPTGSMILPSPHDVYGSLATDTDFICMGLPARKGMIRCYAIGKKEPEARQFIDAYRADDHTIMSRVMIGGLASRNKFFRMAREWRGFL